MENLIKNDKLEQLLIKHWTEFLDYRKLIAFVLQSVRDANLPVYEEDDLPKKGVEINITRFNILDDGFLLWIDFTAPQNDGFAIGTCECILSNFGNLQLSRTVGQILKPRSV
jgi:hypothetical protein